MTSCVMALDVGKSNWDGFIGASSSVCCAWAVRPVTNVGTRVVAALKNMWRDAERMRKGYFNNAEELVAYGSVNGMCARVKPAGKETVPYAVNKRSRYACELCELHVTEFGKNSPLFRRRQLGERYDVSPMPGTRSNYHVQAVDDGKVRFRWMACCCDPCLGGEFDKCLNVAYIGGWTKHVFKNVTIDGVGNRRKKKKEESMRLADFIEKGDVIAVFTADHGSGAADGATESRPFWLAQVEVPVYELETAMICPTSRVEFEKGAHVLEVRYYGRLSDAVAHDRLFKYRGNEGTYLVPVETVRAGGKKAFIGGADFCNVAAKGRATRGGNKQNPTFELCTGLHERIVRMIRDDFDDNYELIEAE